MIQETSIKNKTVQGGCYCGRVSYQIQLPAKWCAHCHCDQCRHTQGAPVVTWFGVDKNNFQYLRGEQDVAWFDSSNDAQRGHCIHCGTPLFFLGVKWIDEVHITRESTQEDILQKPQVHVFYDRHVNYLDFSDQLDKYGGPDGFTALPNND